MDQPDLINAAQRAALHMMYLRRAHAFLPRLDSAAPRNCAEAHSPNTISRWATTRREIVND
ncbi:hypothetical protein [Burkholderia ubonensis]|uniref:hypothetical protein n=1 Tax=Burkholderia ubonensis TaxID=101571 RepID=UPI0012F97153|nr:hypothetical protein [Burkholderia ubonensis]